ncbi:GLPGLI family protein [Flavobacterium sp. J27]|uniref:GLPGLI family protein n=1 Tax=Flavobacterium sp. J27 TaxID=2060419 RepID=UPI00102F5FD2|nr:GLPGLI family protein [Flavobacterium sp. J27]
MKKSIFILCCLFTFLNTIKAQNNISQLYVEYEMYLNFKGAVEYQAQLVLNSNYSLFRYKPSDKVSNYKEDIIDTESKIDIKIIDSSFFYVFIDKIKNVIAEDKKSIYSKKNYVVEEVIPVIDWVLKDDIKMINNLSCKKAVCFFKGRNYTVWYCPEIPINSGPWKLNGLPGLIVEAIDDDHEVAFYLKKIVSPFNHEIELDLTKIKKKYSMKEFLEIQNKEKEEFESKFASKFDRGLHVKVDFKYDDIEK